VFLFFSYLPSCHPFISNISTAAIRTKEQLISLFSEVYARRITDAVVLLNTEELHPFVHERDRMHQKWRAAKFRAGKSREKKL
jgi:hypothetical protein